MAVMLAPSPPTVYQQDHYGVCVILYNFFCTRLRSVYDHLFPPKKFGIVSARILS